MNLTDLITSTFETPQGSSTYDHIFVYSLSYLTGGYTAFEYQRLVKPFCVSMSAKDFRLTLLQHKQIHFGLKLLMLNLSLVARPDFTDFKRATQGIDVDPVDARQAYRVWLDQRPFRARLAKTARRINRVMPITEQYAVELFTRTYPLVLSYVRAITFKKLRFVARSCNLEMTDIHSELMVKVVQAFYKLCPTDMTEAHIVNYLRRAAHNHAMNIIQAATTQKRGRLIKVGHDQGDNPIFSLTVVSENQLNVAKGSGEESTSYDSVGDPDNQMEKFELSFSVTQLLDKYKSRTRKYRFLLILMGQEDAEFTEWLRARKLCSTSSTNFELQLEVSADQYLEWVCKFLHVGQSSANVFLLQVRKELGFDYAGTLKVA